MLFSYQYMLNMAKSLRVPNKVVQLAFTFINDSYIFGLPLEINPKHLAVCALYVADSLLDVINLL